MSRVNGKISFEGGQPFKAFTERRHVPRGKIGSADASRKQRIAKGAGVDISEVNRIAKQFDQMKKMMKQLPGMMGGKRGRGGLGGMLGKLKMPF